MRLWRPFFLVLADDVFLKDGATRLASAHP
jgi:hypothetical protein